eukprot:CAMPEP_0176423708 /NCGR_PEP_ID=MMETSP0127-20121128/10433_1 /TAXON_ID=938130 /ORGANISM="Platyophrya macrostoma, Strain WH" /LENGTH=273 /DNA_ID=CAMNT_0017804687 /DNA_START=9 /DNA_END=830 /DNA_ORIENTATION=+
MKTSSLKPTNLLEAKKWDHNGLKELEQQDQRAQKQQLNPRKTINRSNNFNEASAQGINDRWVHDKIQGDLSPRPNTGEKSNTKSKTSYNRAYNSKYSKLESSEATPKSKELTIDDIYNEGMSSNASTNASSEKIQLDSDKKTEERVKEFQSAILDIEAASTDVSPSCKASNTDSLPFFELSITVSENETRELKIYENQDDLIETLESFCKHITEETSLHIKIFVMKQLCQSKYPDFENFEDYYKELLEQNFKVLIGSQVQSQEVAAASEQLDC